MEARGLRRSDTCKGKCSVDSAQRRAQSLFVFPSHAIGLLFLSFSLFLCLFDTRKNTSCFRNHACAHIRIIKSHNDRLSFRSLGQHRHKCQRQHLSQHKQ